MYLLYISFSGKMHASERFFSVCCLHQQMLIKMMMTTTKTTTTECMQHNVVDIIVLIWRVAAATFNIVVVVTVCILFWTFFFLKSYNMHPKYFNVIVYNFISCMNVSVSMQILLIHTKFIYFYFRNYKIYTFIQIYLYSFFVHSHTFYFCN